MYKPEQLNTKSEHNELQELSKEQLERLDNNIESSVEMTRDDVEAKVEAARIEAAEIAKEVDKNVDEKEKTEKHVALSRNNPINKKQLDDSFTKSIKEMQKELPIGSALFSKAIHNKRIEKASDIIGNSIAKPDAILSGSIFAFIATLSTYLIAKNIGYTLSGFETIFAFAIGWMLGIIFDYIKTVIKH